ncbi:hypothetical protein BCV70DRAFT_113247 [Testicularia cyperi]|uniref:Uncharacterized protein n=1 Tax=Testicularia cyperi TaxID=1882483 RepID=A0A317XNE2_9BASI|nr:hypothetical protein BCV70DRAFT_113247 [Testicularia cyperi]
MPSANLILTSPTRLRRRGARRSGAKKRNFSSNQLTGRFGLVRPSTFRPKHATPSRCFAWPPPSQPLARRTATCGLLLVGSKLQSADHDPRDPLATMPLTAQDDRYPCICETNLHRSSIMWATPKGLLGLGIMMSSSPPSTESVLP